MFDLDNEVEGILFRKWPTWVIQRQNMSHVELEFSGDLICKKTPIFFCRRGVDS